MISFDEWDEFHDWEIVSINLSGQNLDLKIVLNDTYKLLRFKGVVRCQLKDFLVQNVIFDIQLIDKNMSPESYTQESKTLSKIPCLSTDEGPFLAKIVSSVGVDGLIEFHDVVVEDAMNA